MMKPKTRKAAETIAKNGLTPLEFMLSVMRDPKASFERRIIAAAFAAPYLHVKPEKGVPDVGQLIIPKIRWVGPEFVEGPVQTQKKKADK